MSFRQSSPRDRVRVFHGRPQRATAELLIFLHVPKTAGSTMLRILEREYTPKAVLTLYDSTFGDEVAEMAPDQIAHTRVIAGHFYFGLHEHLQRPARYLTFLRDPVERVASHYHFVRTQPEHYLHRAATTMGLAEYVEFCGAAEPNDDQTRLLAGRRMASTDGKCRAEMLPVAKRNLDSHAVVGFTESFDASLVLMRRIFGWGRPFYVRRNVGRERSRADALPAETREVIGAHNAHDVQLYRYAHERFQQQVAAEGDSFARELRAFKELNALYGKLHGAIPPRARQLRARRS